MTDKWYGPESQRPEPSGGETTANQQGENGAYPANQTSAPTSAPADSSTNVPANASTNVTPTAYEPNIAATEQAQTMGQTEVSSSGGANAGTASDFGQVGNASNVGGVGNVDSLGNTVLSGNAGSVGEIGNHSNSVANPVSLTNPTGGYNAYNATPANTSGVNGVNNVSSVGGANNVHNTALLGATNGASNPEGVNNTSVTATTGGAGVNTAGAVNPYASGGTPNPYPTSMQPTNSTGGTNFIDSFNNSVNEADIYGVRGYGANNQQATDITIGAGNSGATGTGGVPPSGGRKIFANAGWPKNSRPSWGSLLVAMAVTCVLSVVLGAGLASLISGQSNSSSTSSSSSTSEVAQSGTVDPVTSTGDSPDWEAVAEAVRPATVTIEVSVNGQDSSTGSGVIWDTDGTIVTNNHVVSDATQGGSIYVILYDGRIYSASIVGTDSTTDLAVIRLDDAPDDLVAARFTTSSDLKVGQEVMAIGSPLGLTDTVTTGIISALDRPVTVSTSSSEQDFFGTSTQEVVTTNAIQVDASLNPGNSGGPLFDSTGAVIGINSSIASLSSSDSSGSIGLGFAIPVDLVKNVVAQIIETGTAEHAVLGVSVSDAVVDVDGATRVGAQVVSVTEDGPAEEAGIEAGDVVISIDGNNVTSSSSLIGYVRRYNSGDEVVVQVVRDGEVIDVNVTLQAE